MGGFDPFGFAKGRNDAYLHAGGGTEAFSIGDACCRRLAASGAVGQATRGRDRLTSAADPNWRIPFAVERRSRQGVGGVLGCHIRVSWNHRNRKFESARRKRQRLYSWGLQFRSVEFVSVG